MWWLWTMVSCGQVGVATLQMVPPGAPPRSAALSAELTRAASDTPRTRHRNEDGSPIYTNRLALQTSPYLLQHAHNPVDWHPWGDEAFALAQRLQRPVLLSVGYATCHWCHVMEEESFEDLEIAEYINAHFVAVKVDREERPDVDAVYMTAVRAINRGRGGWPMTVFLTPDRQAFYGGTYFPARDGDRGSKIGFLTVLQRMQRAYGDDPDGIASQAGQLAAQIAAHLAAGAPGDLPGIAALDRTASQTAAGWDETWGGPDRTPKFPSAIPIRPLLRQHRRTGAVEPLQIAVVTLEAMAKGGLRDQIGGGFHRYTLDRKWRIPHFEKMLYDNALLAVAYAEAAEITGRADLAAVANDTLAFLDRRMSAPGGGFVSASDADSPVPERPEEREEGLSYTWTPDEVRAVLGADADAALAYWDIRPEGDLDGRAIPAVVRPEAEIAASLSLSPDALTAAVDRARAALIEVRDARPQPLIDDKVIAAWNGLAISAFARGALAFDAPAYAERARRAAAFVLSDLRPAGTLMRTHRAGRAANAAVLEDYAFVVAGLIDLFEATAEPRWLAEAKALDATVRDQFEDQRGLWRTPKDADSTLPRERPTSDGAEPSGTSVHVLSLYRLSALTGDDAYRARADHILRTVSGPVREGRMADALLAVDWRHDRAKEIVIVTPTPDHPDVSAFRHTLREAGPRNRVVVILPEAAVVEVTAVAPIVADKVAEGGAVTAYVCEGGVCQAPATDLAAFAAALQPAPQEDGAGPGGP